MRTRGDIVRGTSERPAGANESIGRPWLQYGCGFSMARVAPALLNERFSCTYLTANHELFSTAPAERSSAEDREPSVRSPPKRSRWSRFEPCLAQLGRTPSERCSNEPSFAVLTKTPRHALNAFRFAHARTTVDSLAEVTCPEPGQFRARFDYSCSKYVSSSSPSSRAARASMSLIRALCAGRSPAEMAPYSRRL